jgi:hypothetical protein
MLKTYTVEVSRAFKITLDESKFTPEFCRQFNRTIEDFGDVTDPMFREDTFQEHAKHLGCIASFQDSMPASTFVEGYGILSDMGIVIEEPYDIEADIVDEEEH